MKKISAWLLFLAGLIVIGCGGGGGGGTTTATNATNATNATDATTAVSDMRIGASAVGSAYVDPTNIEVGETAQLYVSGRSSNGQIVNVTATNWATNAPASVATVDATGVVTGVGPSAGTSYVVSAQATGSTVTSSLAVRPAQARVTGRVENVNHTGVGGVVVKFYTAGNTQVGSAVTGPGGTFRASVPTSATQFTINIASGDPGGTAPNIYYGQFEYDGDIYLNGEGTCYAKLPALVDGQTSALAGAIELPARVSGPPPPPTGCVG